MLQHHLPTIEIICLYLALILEEPREDNAVVCGKVTSSANGSNTRRSIWHLGLSGMDNVANRTSPEFGIV